MKKIVVRITAIMALLIFTPFTGVNNLKAATAASETDGQEEVYEGVVVRVYAGLGGSQIIFVQDSETGYIYSTTSLTSNIAEGDTVSFIKDCTKKETKIIIRDIRK